jgi:hypothetical protein
MMGRRPSPLKLLTLCSLLAAAAVVVQQTSDRWLGTAIERWSGLRLSRLEHSRLQPLQGRLYASGVELQRDAGSGISLEEMGQLWGRISLSGLLKRRLVVEHLIVEQARWTGAAGERTDDTWHRAMRESWRGRQRWLAGPSSGDTGPQAAAGTSRHRLASQRAWERSLEANRGWLEKQQQVEAAHTQYDQRLSELQRTSGQLQEKIELLAARNAAGENPLRSDQWLLAAREEARGVEHELQLLGLELKRAADQLQSELDRLEQQAGISEIAAAVEREYAWDELSSGEVEAVIDALARQRLDRLLPLITFADSATFGVVKRLSERPKPDRRLMLPYRDGAAELWFQRADILGQLQLGEQPFQVQGVLSDVVNRTSAVTRPTRGRWRIESGSWTNSVAGELDPSSEGVVKRLALAGKAQWQAPVPLGLIGYLECELSESPLAVSLDCSETRNSVVLELTLAQDATQMVVRPTKQHWEIGRRLVGSSSPGWEPPTARQYVVDLPPLWLQLRVERFADGESVWECDSSWHSSLPGQLAAIEQEHGRSLVALVAEVKAERLSQQVKVKRSSRAVLAQQLSGSLEESRQQLSELATAWGDRLRGMQNLRLATPGVPNTLR